MKGILKRGENTGTLSNGFTDMLDTVFGDSFFSPKETQLSWVPKIDVLENDSAYVVKADLPGIARDDLNVQVENHRLTISGKRENTKDVQENGYHRVERRFGSFERIITLSDDADSQAINAEYKDGVLCVTIGKTKKEEAKKQIVKVS